jgi:hypothetical protein
VLGKLVDFYVGKNKGNDHLHLHYVRFQKNPDGKVKVESLIDPAFFFDWQDTEPPKIVDPLRFVRKGTLDEFPKGDNPMVSGQVPVVSGKVEIIAGISDNAYKDQMCHWMAPVVTLQIEGARAKPWRKLVLDQRGPVREMNMFGAPAMYLSYKEGEKWWRELPPSGGIHFTRVTSANGNGVIEASCKLQSWDTTAQEGGRPRFPDGLYSVTVRAWDIKNNMGTFTATVFVVNKKP